MNVGTAPSAVLGALLSLGAAKGPKLPAGFREPLQGKHASQTREKQTRAGDYRLIRGIQEAGITLLVLELGHRKDVYR